MPANGMPGDCVPEGMMWMNASFFLVPCAGIVALSVATAGPTTQPPADAASGLIIAIAPDSLAERAWTKTGGRTDIATYNEREAFTAERSDEMIKGLRDMGISMLVFPYGGHGPDAYEREERQAAAEFARRVHRAGLLAGVYIPIESVNPAVWAAASQPADAMLIRDAEGRPVASPRDGHFFTSIASSATQDHSKRVLRDAIRNVQPDA